MLDLLYGADVSSAHQQEYSEDPPVLAKMPHHQMQPFPLADQRDPVEEDACVTGSLPGVILRERLILRCYLPRTIVRPERKVQTSLIRYLFCPFGFPLLRTDCR